MIVKLLTEHHLEFLSLKGGCRGSSESTHKNATFRGTFISAHVLLILLNEFGSEIYVTLADDFIPFSQRV